MAGGRPTKLNPTSQERIVQAISMGAPLELAPLAAGVSYPTFRTWMRRGEKQSRGEYRDFHDAVKDAEGRALLKSLAFIEKAAQDGTWTAAAWKLERRYPQFFSRTRVEVTGVEGKPIQQKIQHEHKVESDPRELSRILQILDEAKALHGLSGPAEPTDVPGTEPNPR